MELRTLRFRLSVIISLGFLANSSASAAPQATFKGCLQSALEFVTGSADFRLKKMPLTEFNARHSSQPYRDSPDLGLSYAAPTAELEVLSINETVRIKTWHNGLKTGKLLGYANNAPAVFLQEGTNVLRIPVNEIEIVNPMPRQSDLVAIVPKKKDIPEKLREFQTSLIKARDPKVAPSEIRGVLSLAQIETDASFQLKFLAHAKHLAAGEVINQVALLVVRDLFHSNEAVRSKAKVALKHIQKKVEDPKTKAKIEIQSKVAKQLDNLRSYNSAVRNCERGIIAAVLGSLAATSWDGGAAVSGVLASVSMAGLFSSPVCSRVGAKFAAEGLKKSLSKAEHVLTPAEHAKFLSQTREYLFSLENAQPNRVASVLATVKDEETKLLNSLSRLLLRERHENGGSLEIENGKLDRIRRELTELSQAPQPEIRSQAQILLQALPEPKELSAGNR